jgi:uncharacterized protein (TIGR02246 family)
MTSRLDPRLAVLLLLTVAGCGHAPSRPPVAAPAAQGDADARAAIAEASAAFSQAYVKNDMDALGKVYAEDAVLLPPGREIRGREAIQRYFAWGPNHRQIAHSMVPSELVVSGDMATDHGTWHSTSQRGDDPPTTASGQYLVVWVREPDGAWRIRYDMWHRPAEP